MKDPTLIDYWFILYKRKKAIYLIIMLSIISAAVISSILPKTYEAKSVFFIPQQENNLSFYRDNNGATRNMLKPQVQQEVHAPYLGFLQSNAIIEQIRNKYPRKPFSRYKKDVDFSLNDEYMLEVYVRDRNPEVAANIANAYPEVLNEMIGGFSLQLAMKNLRTLETQKEETRNKLAESEKALKDYQEKNKLYYMSEEAPQLVSLKVSFIKSLDDSMVSLKDTSQEIDSVQAQIKKETTIYVPEEMVVTTPLIEDLKRQIVDLEIKIASTKGALKESHPAVVALKEQYTEAQANLDKEVDRLIKSQLKSPNSFFETLRQNLVNLNVKRETLETRINALKSAIADIDTRINRFHSFGSEMNQLSREVELNKKLVESLQVGFEEERAQIAREIQAVVVVDVATPPTRPVFPILWLNVLVATALGLIGGVFFSFFLNYLESIREDRWGEVLEEEDDEKPVVIYEDIFK